MGGRTRRIDQHVGERIRLRRTELGLTQEQLAAALDVSYQQVQKYETGANRDQRRADLRDRAQARRRRRLLLRGPRATTTPAALPLEHGGRQRSAIELVRKFAQIEDPEVRAAIAGLVKTIVDRAD